MGPKVRKSSEKTASPVQAELRSNSGSSKCTWSGASMGEAIRATLNTKIKGPKTLRLLADMQLPSRMMSNVEALAPKRTWPEEGSGGPRRARLRGGGLEPGWAQSKADAGGSSRVKAEMGVTAPGRYVLRGDGAGPNCDTSSAGGGGSGRAKLKAEAEAPGRPNDLRDIKGPTDTRSRAKS